MKPKANRKKIKIIVGITKYFLNNRENQQSKKLALSKIRKVDRLLVRDEEEKKERLTLSNSGMTEWTSPLTLQK